MSKNNYIPLSVPYIVGNEWKYVKECLDTNWISSVGNFVEEFEMKIAAYVGTKYAVACVNGTAALHISLILAGVNQGDEVLVPTVAFIAPVNSCRYVGAEPVFMDCDDYLNIDVEKTREFIERECYFKNGAIINKASGRTIKAIIPVHVFGHAVDLAHLMEIARKYDLKVIEDATESLGTYYIKGRYKNKKTGVVGEIGCFSFNGNKIITTGGGGIIVTNNKKYAEKAKYLTTQAKDDDLKYIHDKIGYNYCLTNIQAALGVAQLENLEKIIKIKRKNFQLYEKGVFWIDGLRMINEPSYSFSNYWFYSLLIDKKKYGIDSLSLNKILSSKNIQTRPIWYLNHMQKPYSGNQTYKIEKAIKYYSTVLNLPCSASLKQNEIEMIVSELKNQLQRKRGYILNE